jgi:hypothetical protein
MPRSTGRRGWSRDAGEKLDEVLVAVCEAGGGRGCGSEPTAGRRRRSSRGAPARSGARGSLTGRRREVLEGGRISPESGDDVGGGGGSALPTELGGRGGAAGVREGERGRHSGGRA